MTARAYVAAKPLRLGFAGLGWIGLHRMKALLEDGGVAATAVCDTSEAAVAAATGCAPSTLVAGRFEDMLALDLDGVVIATPSAQHAQQTIAALDAGLAVFCQKPLGRTAAEARAAVDAAKRADRLLHVDFSYRFTQAMQAIRQLIASGELGDIYACDLTFHNAYGPDKAWFYDLSQAGGGCVMDLGVHLVDLVLWTLPGARVDDASSSLFSNGERRAHPSGCVEDYAVAHMRLSTGADVRIACSWNLHAGRDAIICAEFHGTTGGARMRNVNGSFYDFVAQRFTGARSETLCQPPDAWGGRAAVHWARTLATSPGFDRAAEDYVRVAQTLDAIYGQRTPVY